MYLQLGLLALKVSFLAGLSLVLTVVPLHAAAAWGATAAEMGTLYSFVTLLSLPVRGRVWAVGRGAWGMGCGV